MKADQLWARGLRAAREDSNDRSVAKQRTAEPRESLEGVKKKVLSPRRYAKISASVSSTSANAWGATIAAFAARVTSR